MNAILVKLTCLTNLHVGNGDVNYNIVDNEVEKDPVTNLPTINASGVKGALRNHFKGNDNVTNWFGSDPKEIEERKPGKIKILSANLLARPYRATSGNSPFQMIAFQESIDRYKTLCDAFGIAEDITDKGTSTVCVEGYKLNGSCYKILGDSFCVVNANEESAAKLRKVELPVIARNYLENGISQNLWYEEVVPHESIFYFIAAAEDSDKEVFNSFREEINKSKVIQFGANASIGYGLCKVEIKGEVSGNE